MYQLYVEMQRYQLRRGETQIPLSACKTWVYGTVRDVTGGSIGARGRNRTTDTRIFNQVITEQPF